MPPGATPSDPGPLERLFMKRGRFKSWTNMRDPLMHDGTFVQAIARIIDGSGLDAKTRKILGFPPATPEGLHLRRHLRRHLNEVAGGWEDGAPEWVEYASNLIRQIGIEEELINDTWRHWSEPGSGGRSGHIKKKKKKKKGVPIDANRGTGLTVDAMGADDAVDSVSGDATDPVFLRQLAGWLQQMDKNPAVQMIMFNLD